jgi:hypothetical protein
VCLASFSIKTNAVDHLHITRHYCFSLFNFRVCLADVLCALRPGLSLNRDYKYKQSRNTPMEAQGVGMYSSYSFTTSALDGGVSGQRHIPAEL